MKLREKILTLVSTHSRLKAAGWREAARKNPDACFNTQPPKGGWRAATLSTKRTLRFNTQPPKGGWDPTYSQNAIDKRFNTQPPKGGWSCSCVSGLMPAVSTHSRLKAAGGRRCSFRYCCICFNTQPPKGGWLLSAN